MNEAVGSSIGPGTAVSDEASRFPAERVARLVEIDRWHFWFRGRRRLLEVVLGDALRTPSELLDVGCGSGVTLAWLQARGHRVDARAALVLPHRHRLRLSVEVLAERGSH